MTPTNEIPEQPRATFAPEPKQPSLLDTIVAESRTERRDELILKREEFNYKRDVATMFAKSNCFTDIDKDSTGAWYPQDVSIARAMMKIEFGASMGFNEGESISGIDIIKGRLAIGAHLRAARMKKAGFSWTQMVCNNKGCWMPLEYKGQPMMHQKFDEATGKLVFDGDKPVMVQVVVSYTEADAKQADLFKKDNYQRDPSAMYFARSITRAQRRYGPEVLGVDVLDTYEARDVTEPLSDIATATNSKTDELAKKLADARESKVAVSEPAATAPVSDPRDASWQERVLSFKTKLGEPEFLAVLAAVTGSESVTSVTFANHEKVWSAMETATKRAEQRDTAMNGSLVSAATSGPVSATPSTTPSPTPNSAGKSGDLF